MDVTWPLWLVVAAVFVSMVLLAVTCLHCRDKGPLVFIPQMNTSEESTEFRVIHPTQPTINQNSIHPSSSLLSPFSSADPGTQRRQRSFTPTETESNPSYENPVDGGPDYINAESDAEDTGYIIVLPGGEAPATDQRRSSCSSDALHDYENIPSEKGEENTGSACSEEDREYLNVDPLHFQRSTPELSAQSDSDDDDDDDDDDDEEGNYVNVNGTPKTE